MRKIWMIMIAVILIGTLAFLSACTTSALWNDQTEDESNTNVKVEETNGSAKYIVYIALDSSGNYIVKDSGTSVASYAVIGYTGLVAELKIPATYQSKHVTKVLVVPDYASYECSMNGAAYSGNDPRLTNNTVVTSIVFGSNVTFIGAGVCAGMVNLTSIKFDTSVALGDSAFAACIALTSVTGSWTPSPAGAAPFTASGYTPS